MRDQKIEICSLKERSHDMRRTPESQMTFGDCLVFSGSLLPQNVSPRSSYTKTYDLLELISERCRTQDNRSKNTLCMSVQSMTHVGTWYNT
jgi:hypothetical protein